jgi:hypothetical protein
MALREMQSRGMYYIRDDIGFTIIPEGSETACPVHMAALVNLREQYLLEIFREGSIHSRSGRNCAAGIDPLPRRAGH